ncbi:MAG: hypothetical protein HZA34_03240 [Candidatus Pacebacteria bacterium]|nr:hypothetical protein [Candidatus Paceibacterota bacterium]
MIIRQEGPNVLTKEEVERRIGDGTLKEIGDANTVTDPETNQTYIRSGDLSGSPYIEIDKE